MQASEILVLKHDLNYTDNLSSLLNIHVKDTSKPTPPSRRQFLIQTIT